MTIEDLERGMKLLFDQEVHLAGSQEKLEKRQERLEAAQDRTDQQIAALTGKVSELTDDLGQVTIDLGQLTDTQTVTMRAITSMVASVGELREAQMKTDSVVAALAESQTRTEASLATLAHRIDAFIAALGNGHQKL